MSSTPQTVVSLEWQGELEFTTSLSQTSIVMDSRATAGPSPVELLAASLAGCMSIDLVHILTKGRHVVRSLKAQLVAARAPQEPRRFEAVTLHFSLDSAAPHDVVARAIELSRSKYCSVWHSMRQDIDLQVTFELAP